MRDLVCLLCMVTGVIFYRLPLQSVSSNPTRRCILALLSTSTSAFSTSKASPFLNPQRTLATAAAGKLFSSSYPNGERPGDKDKKSREEGETGWNHNKPKGNRGEGSSSASKELRTGWLHNTRSPSADAEAKGSSATKETSLARRRLEIAMKQQIRNHRMVSPPTFHATGNQVIMVTEHVLSLPVSRNSDSKKRVDVFFTIVEKLENVADRAFWQELNGLPPSKRAEAYVQRAALQNAEGMLLFLQGGPGFGAPIPVVSLGMGKDSSWAAKALEMSYSRLVLMDQRGTGKSTPITKQTLQLQFPDLFLLDNKRNITDMETSSGDDAGLVDRVQKAVPEAADYLANFRADNIVQDAEEIRDALLLPGSTVEDEKVRPWGCVLGQSFGGFCTMTYLSQVEYPPKICLLTGGIAPMLTHVDDVYDSLWDRVKQRSLAYYELYPGDISLIKQIVRKLLEAPPKLPAGGTLTARRFLQLGISLGSSPHTFAALHSLFSSALIPTPDGGLEFSRAFLKRIESEQSFDDHPIYFWLHEACYVNQDENAPTNWSAHRVYERKTAAAAEFDYRLTSSLNDDEKPTLFFGEMIFPWMTQDYAELSGYGLELLAETLATKKDWTPLYNGERMLQVLQDGRTFAAAAVYYDDLYVDFDASAKVFAPQPPNNMGPMSQCKIWITNEYQHSGLRDDGARIFEKLHGMATGKVRTPS